MRKRWIAWGIVGVVAGAFTVGWLQTPSARAQYGTPPVNTEPGSLMVYQGPGPDGWQHILVVDPVSRVMASYQVNPTSGAISLRSVRKIAFDLLMDDFNGGDPSSQQIKQMIDQR
jgi:hypothetical protein